MNIFDEAANKHERLTLLNTNARSLCPKIDSLIDNMRELDSPLAVVTETWLADGSLLEQRLADLQEGEGLSVVHKNRKGNRRGVTHGGVCIVGRVSRV